MKLYRLSYLVVLTLIVCCLFRVDPVYAKEIVTSRTEGVIRFIGDNNKESNPKPPAGEWLPPGEEEGGGKIEDLPQLNSQQREVYWIGVLFVSVSVGIYVKKQRLSI